jgi:Helix-turn-helix domain of resolvase.
VKFGPPARLSAAQLDHARALIEREGRAVREIAQILGVHRATLYRALARR